MKQIAWIQQNRIIINKLSKDYSFKDKEKFVH